MRLPDDTNCPHSEDKQKVISGNVLKPYPQLRLFKFRFHSLELLLKGLLADVKYFCQFRQFALVHFVGVQQQDNNNALQDVGSPYSPRDLCRSCSASGLGSQAVV